MEVKQDSQQNIEVYPSEETEEEPEPKAFLEEKEQSTSEEQRSQDEVRDYKFRFAPSFVNGLSVGVGIGAIATFTILWIALIFTPLLPTAVTYESLLSMFVYPLMYLLAIGLVALTAGIVREYYFRKYWA